MNFNIKIVNIENVKIGMTVGEDIYTDTDMFLLEKGTKLTQKLIKKLKLYGIQIVPIKKAIKEETKREDNDEVRTYATNMKNTRKSIKKTKEYKLFKSNHENKKEVLKSQIMDISEGKKVEIDNLFSISDSLLDSIDSKGSLFSFINNLENFDDSTYTHSVNVSLIAYTLGEWLNFNENQLKEIAVAGLIHDVGKTNVDINILNKIETLTESDIEEIRKHPIYGFKAIEKQDISYNVKMAVLMHHERYDGSGYPLGAKNEQISDYAKIIAIADIYDAMTSNRIYRKKYSPFEVIRRLEHEYLTKLDTQFLMTFLHNIAYCYLGNWVELSTGEEGKIVFINKHKPSKPIVQVDNVMIDISQEKDVSIVSIF